MRIVRDLTAEVHAYNRESGRSLAFLASDCIGVNKWVNKPPYALVADGTYQDTHCDPESWSYGIFPNYRNALWSCNWEPVTHLGTEFAFGDRRLCHPNGYGDDAASPMTAGMKKVPTSSLAEAVPDPAPLVHAAARFSGEGRREERDEIEKGDAAARPPERIRYFLIWAALSRSTVL
jgi:hypothetical protein